MNSVDEYIQQFSANVQNQLSLIRNLIKKCAPDAEESISYGMPAYKLCKKPLVYYAAYENHIGFYATPSGHSAFKDEMAKYKQGKGSVQFALNEKLPVRLITKIIKFRVQENLKKHGKN
ncbi:MAG: DUF1801 domain-containing protein [Sphingobacteriaceae bacterium]|nr:DUF1801 domain-containing protein [Sphingobacteriaceae bacterium]